MPFISSPGSANSLAKSMNGSIKSDTLSAGSGGTTGEDGLGMDGDNINVVIRVRPLNQKEVKSCDESILTFPGDGGIWVSDIQCKIAQNVVIRKKALHHPMRNLHKYNLQIYF